MRILMYHMVEPVPSGQCFFFIDRLRLATLSCGGQPGGGSADEIFKCGEAASWLQFALHVICPELIWIKGLRYKLRWQEGGYISRNCDICGIVAHTSILEKAFNMTIESLD